ncbi:hypothetical protein HFO26_24515 [Rhizobium leguminosarum]|uniref:hypothetical protein n=1 Tax=Rhizobium leguminosarum TaxID=384 RepID=UPI001C98037D|nr:hypothetical protein [Rhizobium leguminosarum]MBY5733419.1 hypothetical protein [Rhizobium leguminosarum]
MAIVSYPLADCPGCGGSMSFGNVDVYGSFILRGCGRCRYTERLPLPEIHKRKLYLDQSFLSLVFKAEDGRYLGIAEKIKSICAKQALVVPYSNIHEDETHQWKNYEALLDFIKATARGHELRPSYEVIQAQFDTALQLWLTEQNPNFPVERNDAFDKEIDEWESYYRIDVAGYYGDIEKIRAAKITSITGLVETFDTWRDSFHSKEEHINLELASAAAGYINAYKAYLEKVDAGDYDDLLDRPINSKYVERMVRYRALGGSLEERVQSTFQFLYSPNFAAMPAQSISARIYAELREQVRRGAYAKKAKAIERLSGFFFDVDHISIYGPYFDSIVVDRSMHELLRSNTVDLSGRWGTKVFSASNLDEFDVWLGEIEQAIPPEHRGALPSAYPRLVV